MPQRIVRIINNRTKATTTGLAVFLTLKVEVKYRVNVSVHRGVNVNVHRGVNVNVHRGVNHGVIQLKHELSNHYLICALRWASALTSSFTRAICEGIFAKRKIKFSLQCSLFNKISSRPEIFPGFLLHEAEAYGGASSYLRIAHV